jgi:outer membrane protein
MKKFLFGFALVANLNAHNLAAQTDTLRLSQAAAIELGIKNSPRLAADNYQVRLAEGDLTKAKHAILPEINANANVRYNTQLQKTVLPAGFGGNSEAQELAFGTRNNTNVSIDLNQPLYDPSFKTNLAKVKTQIEIEQNAAQQTRRQIRYDIAEAYLNAQYRRADWQQAQRNRIQRARIEQLAAERLKVGNLLENEFLKIKLDVQNAIMKEKTAEQEHEAALNTLRKHLNLGFEVPIAVEDWLEKSENAAQSTPSVAQPNFDNKLSIQKLNLQNRMNELELKKLENSRWLPTVSLNANYSTQFQANDFNYFGSGWSPFNYVGVKASLPIFDRFQNKDNQLQSRLKMEQTRHNLQTERQNLAFDAQQSQVEVRKAQENLNYALSNQALAEKIYADELARFEKGVLLYNDLLSAEKSVFEARTNVLQSRYSVAVAQLKVQKAMGVD